MARSRSHLIPTKFVPPTPRPELVPRARLLALLRAAFVVLLPQGVVGALERLRRRG